MKSHLNLLPWQIRYRLVLRARLLQWSLVMGFMLVMLAVIGTYKFHGLRQGRQIVATQEDQVRPLEDMQQRNAAMKDRLEQLSGLELLLAEVERSQYTLGLVGLISRSAARTEERIQVIEFDLRRQSESRKRKGPDGKEVSEPVEVVLLTLKGIAVDDLAVARFVAELHDSGAFAEVKLTSSIIKEVAVGIAREYQVDCRL